MKGKLAIHGGPKSVPDGVAIRWPIITDEDKRAVMRVLDRGILYGVYAPEILGLEKEFAEFVHAKHGMATGGRVCPHTTNAPGDRRSQRSDLVP